MIQVISALRIEENHKSSLNAITHSKVNLVENQTQKQNDGHKHNYNKNNEKNQKKRKNQFQYPNKNHSNPNDKSKGSNGKVKLCYVCGRTNHLAKDCFYKKTEHCKQRKESGRPQANVLKETETFTRYGFNINFTYQDNDWWFDSGANVHVCFDIKMV